jgi:hypothetical protein
LQNDDNGINEVDEFIKNWLINFKLKNFLKLNTNDSAITFVRSITPKIVIMVLRLLYKLKTTLKQKSNICDILLGATEEYKKTLEKEINEIRASLCSEDLLQFLLSLFKSSPELLKDIKKR